MIKKIYVICIAALFMFACGEDSVNDPRGSKAVPKQVTVTGTRDVEGASVIYYNRPDDQNLKYVRAVWTTDDGVQMDATASFYTDSILVEGFGAAGQYKVDLYSVSTGEVSSEPVSVTINPKTPPYISAYNNMEMFPYFMGIRASVNNNYTKAKLSLFAYKKNSSGEWDEIGALHTSMDSIDFKVTGQDTLLSEYGFRVRDRWQHWSEMKTFQTTPWWEELCDKKLYSECKVTRINADGENVWDSECLDYQGHDMHSWSGSYVTFAALWDGRIMTTTSYCYHTKPAGTKLPQSFCIDLGKPYTLSRLVFWPRGASTNLGAGSNDWQYSFSSGMPLRIRLYGATYTGGDPLNLKDDIEDSDAWILLSEEIITRADGTVDQVLGNAIGTDEDRAKIEAGLEILMPSTAPKIRYFRFQTLETYGKVNAVMLDEFNFYGSDK